MKRTVYADNKLDFWERIFMVQKVELIILLIFFNKNSFYSNFKKTCYFEGQS